MRVAVLEDGRIDALSLSGSNWTRHVSFGLLGAL